MSSRRDQEQDLRARSARPSDSEQGSGAPSGSARWGEGTWSPRRRQAGFTLIEALVAIGLVASAGVVASTAAVAMLRLERAAHAEAAGLAAASEKLEELIGVRPADRRSGNDATTLGGVDVARVWRVLDDQPALGLTRLEVTSRWDHPRLTLLTLVTAVPGRSTP